MWKIVLAATASVGGIAGLIVVSIRFSVKFIAERLQKKYDLRLNKEFEKLRSGLDKKNYISKARFDKEFVIYQELSEKILDMINTNVMLFVRVDRLPQGKDDVQKIYIQRYDSAVQSYNAASRAIYANAPFIPKEFYDLFCDVRKKCVQQISEYQIFKIDLMCGEMRTDLKDEYGKCFDRSEEISEKLDEIILKVRDYLSSLDVYEQ